MSMRQLDDERDDKRMWDEMMREILSRPFFYEWVGAPSHDTVTEGPISVSEAAATDGEESKEEPVGMSILLRHDGVIVLRC